MEGIKMITLEDFKKIDLRIAKIVEAEKIEGADKLLKLKIDLGDPSRNSGLGMRQVVAGIALSYPPEDLIGRQIAVVVNLEPRILKGVVSEGMLLAVSENEKVFLLQPDSMVSNGSQVS